MFRTMGKFAALLLLLVSIPAQSCLPPPPDPNYPRMPTVKQASGETDEKFLQRKKAVEDEHLQRVAEYNRAKEIEKDRDWLERQQELLDQSSHIVIATYTKHKSYGAQQMDMFKFKATFNIEKWLLGKGKAKKIRLKGRVYTLCGISSSYGLHRGKIDDQYAFLSTDEKFSKESIITAIKLPEITLPALKDLVEE